MKCCVQCNASFDGGWTCPECKFTPTEQNGYLTFSPELSISSSSGFDLSQFTALHEVEQAYFWFKSRTSLIAWALGKFFPAANRYFEIGCGTGYVLQEIEKKYPDVALSASEISVAGLPFAATNAPSATLFQMDARSLPFKEEFDVIGAYDVIEHIEEDEKVLQQMHEAIRPGGGIILTVPQHDFLWSTQDESSGHFRRYSREDLVQKVSRAGFEVVKVTSFVSLLLPLLLVSRYMKNTKQQTDLAEEFKIGKLTNGILLMVMQLERLMILSGISFPAGGSLLLIGRKAAENSQ